MKAKVEGRNGTAPEGATRKRGNEAAIDLIPDLSISPSTSGININLKLTMWD